MKQVLAIAMLVAALPGSAVVHAQPGAISGRVLRVQGPDTVIVEGPGGVQYPVKLRGTQAAPSNNPAGGLSQSRLAEDLVGRQVTVTDLAGSASTGLQGVINYGNEDLNRRWVEEGLLSFDEETAAPDQKAHYISAEDEARESKRGIWQDPRFQPATPEPGPGQALAAPQYQVPEPAWQPPREATPPPGGWRFRPQR